METLKTVINTNLLLFFIQNSTIFVVKMFSSASASAWGHGEYRQRTGFIKPSLQHLQFCRLRASVFL
jgi:hypothetical protein